MVLGEKIDVSEVAIPERDPFVLPSFPPTWLVAENERTQLEKLVVDAVRAGASPFLLYRATRWPREEIDKILTRWGVTFEDGMRGLQALVSYHVGDLVWHNIEARGRPVHKVCEDMGLSLLELRRHYAFALQRLRVRTFAVQPLHDHDLVLWSEPWNGSAEAVDVPDNDPFIGLPDLHPAEMTAQELEELATDVVQAFQAGERIDYISRRTQLPREMVHNYLRDAGLSPEATQPTSLLRWIALMVIERMTREHLAGEGVRVLARRYRMTVDDVITHVGMAAHDVINYDTEDAW
ncbi:hypothetical protein [Allokutzneria albata]|uniref:hypothetical protein n=1 Tax=Allokutzneria albata TaxID=211114 RepID=UPI0004C2CD68|nr:hypothetical protein [Allokutzneria albata]